MSNTDDELDKLREQTDPGTRAESKSENPKNDLESTIVSVLEEIENGETSKTLSVRDHHLAALIRGLEEADELVQVGAALQTELNKSGDSEGIDRSEVIRLAVRLGLKEAAPDVVETARDAYGRHAADNF